MLTKGSDNWSLAEVVHAIILLVHFHCLCSFVFACGMTEEEQSSAMDHSLDCDTDHDTTVGVETLMQRMKTLSEKVESETV